MKTRQTAHEILSEIGGKLPSVAELFNIFSQINLDCVESNETPVDFSDVEFYCDQITNIWNPNDKKDWLKFWATACALKDYAKNRGYVLPTRA